MAQIADTTTRTVQRVESESSISLETLKAIANAFGVGFRELLFVPEPESAIAQREELEARLARHEKEKAVAKEIVARLAAYWNSKTPGIELNEWDHRSLEKWRRDFSDEDIMDAMDIAEWQYLEFDGRHRCTRDSAERAFGKVAAICYVSREAPQERDIYCIRGMLRKRISGYFDEARALQWLRAARRAGVESADLKALVGTVCDWSQFRLAIENLTSDAEAGITTPGPQSSEGERTQQPLHQESPPSASAHSKDALDYLALAVEVLKRARESGEGWITIDFEQKTYCFGRSPDGMGTSYPIEHYFAADELAGAIERGFLFVASRR